MKPAVVETDIDNGRLLEKGLDATADVVEIPDNSEVVCIRPVLWV